MKSVLVPIQRRSVWRGEGMLVTYRYFQYGYMWNVFVGMHMNVVIINIVNSTVSSPTMCTLPIIIPIPFKASLFSSAQHVRLASRGGGFLVWLCNCAGIERSQVRIPPGAQPLNGA